MALLEVNGLCVGFHNLDYGYVQPLDEVEFALETGQVLGMVGETGSGKSLTAHAVLGLTRFSGGETSGEVIFKGQNLLTLSEEQMQNLRGAKLSFIPQNPMTSLDPVYRVGDQIAEGVIKHLKLPKKQARRRAVDLMQALQIPNPEGVFHQYPHQLSGGLKQRIVIAMGLCADPDLLIADEPTTALDVTVQAQIVALFKELTRTQDIALLLITHDLGIIARICDKVAVMYAGRVVEYGSVGQVFHHPRHPYTEALLQCVPVMGMQKGTLAAIEGNVPSVTTYPAGCRYHPRCPHVMPQCRQGKPAVTTLAQDTRVACFRYPRG